MIEERDKLDVALEGVAPLALLAISPSDAGQDPIDDAVLRLVDGHSLPPRERQRLTDVVDAAPLGRARLEILREALAEVGERAEEAAAVAETNGDSGHRVKLVFHWARDSMRYLCGTLLPRKVDVAPVAVRGEAAAQEIATYYDFAHEFDDMKVLIAVERVPHDRFDVQLDFTGDARALDRLRVTLHDADGRPLDSQPVEDQSVRFAALRPETHRVDITAAQEHVGRVVLDVHGA